MRVSMVVAGVAFACVLGFGLAVQAGQDAPKEHSMSGCLAKGAAENTFKLTNVDRVNTVDISETTANLTPHVGHKVEITGTAVPGKETHTMKVTAMKHVSPTCP